MKLTKQEVKKQLKSFWRDEIVASEVYQFTVKRVKSEKKETFVKFSKMEKGHSEVWNNVAEREGFGSFHYGPGVKIQVFFMKLLSLFLPLPILVNFLEFQERNAIFKYSKFLDIYHEHKKTRNLIERVIRDEFLHETHMMEMVLDRMSYINRSRQAIHGFTLAIMNIFALLIGLIQIIPDPSTLLITGIITVVSGGFVSFASTFISARGYKDIRDNRVNEIAIKEEIHPEALREDLKNILLEKDISDETTNDILEIIGDDYRVLSNLIRSIRSETGGVPPLTSALVTAGYFFIGGIPVILPFIFPVIFPGFLPIYAGIVSAGIALILTVFAGSIIGILSGKRMLVKAFEKVLIIVVASGLMYLIGFLISLIPGV